LANQIGFLKRSQLRRLLQDLAAPETVDLLWSQLPNFPNASAPYQMCLQGLLWRIPLEHALGDPQNGLLSGQGDMKAFIFT
jgi:hypothetical protein